MTTVIAIITAGSVLVKLSLHRPDDKQNDLTLNTPALVRYEAI